MYVILGASGHTGSMVAAKLLEQGKKVRAVGRDKERLAPLVKNGAEAFEGDISDRRSLREAFHGAEAVYAMVPPEMSSNDYRSFQDRASGSIAWAIEDSGVKHVVALSSIGAGKESKTGPVVGLHYFETKLNRIPGINLLNLRPGYFMENLLAQVFVIKEFGMMAGPLDADLMVPMIATSDIGAAAADALLKLDFSGKQTRELLGQRDLSYMQAAKIVGAVIGKPALAYVQLPDNQLIQSMVQMGMSRNTAELLCEMSASLNNGHMKALEPRSAANTTPTSFEQFVSEEFVPAYQGKSSKAAKA